MLHDHTQNTCFNSVLQCKTTCRESWRLYTNHKCKLFCKIQDCDDIFCQYDDIVIIYCPDHLTTNVTLVTSVSQYLKNDQNHYKLRPKISTSCKKFMNKKTHREVRSIMLWQSYAKQTYSTGLVDEEGVQRLQSLSRLSLAWLLQLLSVSVEAVLWSRDRSRVSSEEVNSSRALVTVVDNNK